MNAIERQESTLLFERIGGLRIKHILIWLITSVISVVILFPLTNRTGTIGPTGNIIYAVNLTAVSIITGIPYLLGTSLLWSFQWSGKSILSKSNEQTQYIIQFTKRWSLTILLNTLFMSLISIITLIFSSAHMGYIITLTISNFIISIFLSSLSILLIVSFDDIIRGTLGGIAVYYMLGAVMGLTPFQTFYGQICLYAPYHLYRFVSIIISGVEFETSDTMRSYMDLFVKPDALIFPLILWITISLMALFLSSILFLRNIKLWGHRQMTWETPEVQAEHRQLKRTLPRQQQIAAASVVLYILFMTTINYVGVNYIGTDPMQNPREEIIYQSPVGGEQLVLGIWRYGEVDFSQLYVTNDIYWRFDLEILSWGDAPNNASFTLSYKIEKLTIEEFHNLNESEKESLFNSQNLGIGISDLDIGTGWTSIQTSREHVWASRFTSQNYETGDFTFLVSITITVRGY